MISGSKSPILGMGIRKNTDTPLCFCYCFFRNPCQPLLSRTQSQSSRLNLCRKAGHDWDKNKGPKFFKRSISLKDISITLNQQPMKLILILASALFFSLQPMHVHPNQGQLLFSKKFKDTVYICNSTTATKYHSKDDCRGLNACKADIISIDKQDAIRKGRDECGWCW
jgi:hypothetical protein